MLSKRSGKLITLAIFVVAMLASLWGTALAASDTETSADFGGQGIVMPAGIDRDNLQIELVKPSSVSGANLRFRGPLLDISYKANGQELSFPPSLTYVYFNMNSAERAAWDRGTADIYYLDTSTNAWKKCGTTFLVQMDNPQGGRLACVAPQLTRYGLGISKELEELQPGVVSDEGAVNASLSENAALFGNQGVDVPAGLNSDQVLVRMLNPNLAPAMPFHALRQVIQIEWIGNLTQAAQPAAVEAQQAGSSASAVASATSSSGKPVTPLSLTYVYFNLDNDQRNAWDAGNLHIYYYDQNTKSWSTCPAFFVNKYVEIGHGRISCVAPQFTYYALGMTKVSSSAQ
jgi:hypothetical protein